MRFTVQAACGCHIGKIRKTNEDNFFFDGKCLKEINTGLKHPVWVEDTLRNGFGAAIFDGMGGESFGELASYAAARSMQAEEKEFADFFVPEKTYLQRLVQQLNGAVVAKKEEMMTEHMGSTLVGLRFTGRYVYAYNVGDSRAYRLRDREFQQISKDHVVQIPGKENKKAPLSQYLGVDPEEMELEPYIAKGRIEQDDVYLLCSDGLTDMLTNVEISDIMIKTPDPELCVQALIKAALDHGGRDNITVILIRIA